MIGDFGVRVFFVISGYLITRLLLDEHERQGTVSLRAFYWRRCRRIFPAFYFYVLVVFLLSKWGVVELHRFDLVEAVTYTVNYFPWDSQSHPIRHIWSLSNEEQFYLLWPACIVLLKPRRAMVVAAASLFIVPLVRLAIAIELPPAILTIDRRFDCLADVLATGCLLAGMRPWLTANPAYLRFLRSPWFLLAPGVAVTGVLFHDHPKIFYFVGESAMNLGIALCIDRAVRIPNDAAGRFLNWAPLRRLGVMSYSLYLWQQLFLVSESNTWWCAFPTNVGLTAITSWMSYQWIERPFFKARRLP